MKCRAILIVTAVVLLGACGGEDDGADELAALQGNLAYVDSIGGRDRIFVADNSVGLNSHELLIGHLTVLPAHDAGAANLKLEDIASIDSLAWNEDGLKLAVVVRRSSSQSQLLILDTETGNAVTASPQEGEIRNPDWAPDGSRVAYLLADAGFTNTRLASTEIETGEVQEFEETRGLPLTAHRWDATSRGLRYFFFTSGSCAQYLLDIDTRQQVCEVSTRTKTNDSRQFLLGFPEDLSRTGAGLVPNAIPEVSSLVYFELGWTVSAPIRTTGTQSLFFSWFLPSSQLLVAIEELAPSESIRRADPLIASLTVAGSGANALSKTFYTVKAPEPLKWDFWAP